MCVACARVERSARASKPRGVRGSSDERSRELCDVVVRAVNGSRRVRVYASVVMVVRGRGGFVRVRCGHVDSSGRANGSVVRREC